MSNGKIVVIWLAGSSSRPVFTVYMEAMDISLSIR